MPSDQSEPRESQVAILLCTFQGERFLAEQLQSIERQTHKNWTLWISDDHSTDRTLDIAKDFQNRIGSNRVFIVDGPQRGFVKNFLSLACRADIIADFYSYCDQDDIWMDHKLERAVSWLWQTEPFRGALYCSRTMIVDEQNHPVGFSPLFSKRPSFSNALVQNIGGGNTMVFNRAARELLKSACPNQDIVSHDWWTYLVVSGVDGAVCYDPDPTVRYRQHENNVLGRNTGWRARLLRLKMLMRGRFRNWNDQNIAALSRMKSQFASENQLKLQRFIDARRSSIVMRLFYMAQARLYRQTIVGNIGLVVGALINKI